MARGKASRFRRAFRQMDLAFWCLHEHLPQMALLGVPTLMGASLIAASIALLVRMFNLSPVISYALYAVIYPALAHWVFTFAPLPCAVFVWHRAAGRVPTAGECFRECFAKSRRLLWRSIGLGGLYFVGYLFFGIPVLIFWPRTCLVPMVVLFENERRVFARSARLLKQEHAVYLLVGLFTLLLVTLALLVATPHLLMLANIIQAGWVRSLREYMWVFEFVSGAVIIAGMSVAWSISLTLLYRDIRRLREGEELREKIHDLRRRFVTAT